MGTSIPSGHRTTALRPSDRGRARANLSSAFFIPLEVRLYPQLCTQSSKSSETAAHLIRNLSRGSRLFFESEIAQALARLVGCVCVHHQAHRRAEAVDESDRRMLVK